jgi:hypothetical protein
MESVLSQNLFFADRAPVPASEVRIESIGVNPLDQRRVDVAVDLTPCLASLIVKMAIVGPDDEEASATTIIHNRETMLDKIMHLRRDAQPGTYTLHVGVFEEEELLHRAARQFVIAPPESSSGYGTQQ